MHTHSVSFLGTVILSLAAIASAAAESAGDAGPKPPDPAPLFPKVGPMPAELPAVAEDKRAAVLSMNMALSGGQDAMNKSSFERLQETLERKGDWAAAEKLSDWSHTLEKFYNN